MGCSPPETLELGARGNAEKNIGLERKQDCCGSAAIWVCQPTKNGKKTKNGFLTECGSFFSQYEDGKKTLFLKNRPKKGKMYHENLR